MKLDDTESILLLKYNDGSSLSVSYYPQVDWSHLSFVKRHASGRSVSFSYGRRELYKARSEIKSLIK